MSKEFTIKEFVRHLEAVAKALADEGPESVLHNTMRRACTLVQWTAQDYLGTYARAAGPYPAWAPLAEATKEDRERRGYLPDLPLIRTGELIASIQFKVEGLTGYVGSDAPQAVWMELGTSRIPARSFLARAAYVNEFKIHKMFVVAVLKTFGPEALAGAGKMTTQAGFGGIEL